MPQKDCHPVNGKVLRLHFACRAELPHGSSLRVTSSELWTATHEHDHHGPPIPTLSRSSTFDHTDDDDVDNLENSSLYTSTVEMVTTPETYPIWRTRNPVIRVVNHTSEEEEGILRHRYRYLTITPGDISNASGSGSGMITSDGSGGAIEVDMFEDPFLEATTNTKNNEQPQSQRRNVDDLPYRTEEIDVSSVHSSTFGKTLRNPSSSQDSQFTSDGVRIDEWNNIKETGFIPYLETVEKSKNQKGSNGVWTSESDSDALVSDKTEEGEMVERTNESSQPKRIFLVCYHLPIILGKNPYTGEFTAKFSESLIAKTEQSGVSKSHDTHWIGTVSLDLKTEEERDAVRKVLQPLHCTPIFLEKSVRDSFYLGMCKQVLWPAFHNIDLLDISKSGWGNMAIADAPNVNNWDQSRLDYWWTNYCQVNRIFAETLSQMIEPHDKIWVHDYHLALLPQTLSEMENSRLEVRSFQMVFFLHIPFPTSQVFRELEHGAEILKGMLHADVVGFHSFDHARHFLNASKRILGLSHENLVGGLIGVKYRGTKVLVTISNVSIETDVVEKCLISSLVSIEAESLKAKYGDCKIIAGIDIAQGLSGVSLKLLAYERLLTDYPNWVGKVVLVQKNLVPSSRKTDENDTLNHVRYLVQRLKSSFGRDVIDYEEIEGSCLPMKHRLALWLSSDVFMSTPIREGLNLLPCEYVYTRKHPTEPGVTMVSEFSALSSILNGALRVNPYDIKMTSTMIDTALSMSVEEKNSRRERDIHFVSTSPSGQWTRNVLRDLNDVVLASDGSDRMNKKSMRASAKMDFVNAEIEISSSLLDPFAVRDAYNLAEKRVIFVDFNGTIVMKEPAGKYLKREMLGMMNNKPPEETIEALTKLCADDRNVVFVVSGDTESNIENAIGNIPGLGLAAGNGGSISLPQKSGKRIWEKLDLGVDWDAVQNIALPLISKYTARANGSYIKLSSSSIGWSYYSCDPEWGEMLATHLVVELEIALHAFDIRLVTLKGVVEVVPKKLNKGQVIKSVLTHHPADFILCMGDDVSDEKMFSSVFSMLAESDSSSSTQNESNITSHVFTVAVGKKMSNASYYVESTSEVAELLYDISGLFSIRATGRAMSWDKDNDDTLAPELFA